MEAVRQHCLRLYSKVFLQLVYHRQRLRILGDVGRHIRIDDEVSMHVDRCQRRVIGGISAFFIRQHLRVRICAGQLSWLLGRINTLFTPGFVGRCQLLSDCFQQFVASLGVRQFWREFHGSGRSNSLVFCRVRLVRIVQPPPKLINQLRQLLLHLGACQGFVAIVIRLDPCTVKGHLPQANHTHVHRKSTYLAEQFSQLFLESLAEFADCGVVNRPPLRQPHEINVVAGHILQHPAGSNPACHPVQDDRRQNTGVDRWLAAYLTVLADPARPIHRLQNLVENPDFVLFRDHVVQRPRNQN